MHSDIPLQRMSYMRIHFFDSSTPTRLPLDRDVEGGRGGRGRDKAAPHQKENL